MLKKILKIVLIFIYFWFLYQTNFVIKYNLNDKIYVIICSILFALITLLIIYLYKETIKLLKKIIIKFHLFFIVEIIISMTMVFLLFLFNYKSRINGIYIVGYIELFISLLVLFIYLVIPYILDKELKKEKLFLLIVIPISISYMVFVLPAWVPDEEFHLYRSYNNLEKNYFLDELSADVPIDVKYINKLDIKNYGDLNKIAKKNDLKNSIEVRLGNTLAYPSLLYTFSSIGIFIGKLFNFPTILSFYLGRFMNLIFSWTIGYLIVKIIPFGKILTLIYLLNPLYLWQSISYSADVIVNGVSLLFIAYILKIKFSKEFITKKQYIILLILAIILALSKYVYVGIVGLSLLIFGKLSDRKKISFSKIIIILVVTILSCINIYFHSMGLSVKYNKQYTPIPIEQFKYNEFNKILTKRTSKYIVLFNEALNLNEDSNDGVASNNYIDALNNFGDLIKTIIYTIKVNFSKYLLSFCGYFASYENFYMISSSSIFPIIYLLILIISPFLEQQNYQLSKKSKIWIMFIFMFISLIIFYGFYAQGGAKRIIGGIQGRYFIPILLLPLLCLIDKEKIFKIKKLNLSILVILMIVHSGILLSAIDTFSTVTDNIYEINKDLTLPFIYTHNTYYK